MARTIVSPSVPGAAPRALPDHLEGTGHELLSREAAETALGDLSYLACERLYLGGYLVVELLSCFGEGAWRGEFLVAPRERAKLDAFTVVDQGLRHLVRAIAVDRKSVV